MIPLLPSLLPRAAAQTAPEIRYIQMISAYGQYAQHFYPADTGLVAQTGGIMAKPLSSISGDISRVLGPAFTPLKNKISLLRGMHVLAASNLHNGCMPTCASGTPEDAYDNGRPVFPYSIDTVLSESAKIYPNASGKQRHVNVCPEKYPYDNFSWNNLNGSSQQMSQTNTTSALLAKFTTLGSTPTPPPQDPVQARKVDIIQGVYDDYKAVRDSGKLSANDKMRFESYISLIDELQRGLASTPPPAQATCTKPTQESESTTDATHRNQTNILVAAMACGLTRVASHILTVSYEPMHSWSHDTSQSTKHADAQKLMGEKVAYLISQMSKVIEGSGTLLDNSIVYWGNEYGENANGDAHRPDNMTAVIAGGAAGLLQLGYYIDYRKTGGIPFNNFLISLFNAMGLSSSDYQRAGVTGFGEYDSGAISARKLSAATGSAAERRKPLPFFYKGTALG
jgi:hypothetical protein